MRSVGAVVALLLGLWLAFSGVLQAQGFGAVARLVPEHSLVDAERTSATLELLLSQPVPFRVQTFAEPQQIVVEFRDVQFGDWASTVPPSGLLTDVTTGPGGEPGWTRLTLALAGPALPQIADMRTDPVTGQARVTLRLASVRSEVFLAEAIAMPAPLTVDATPRAAVDDRFIVVLDPGHGGVDPGAVRDGVAEADLVLTFARELRDRLRRTGDIEVVLTREGDVFVPLPTRVTLARAVEADLFLSIHADAIPEGRARGATIYTLSERATDAAAAALAEQHDRADLLQGIDLHGADDEVAGILMDLARQDTAPRSKAFADQLVESLGAADLRLHRRPRGSAGFTVLRAADIPSVLLEAAFMSDPRDLSNLQSPEWRAQMQDAILDAIRQWAVEDAVHRSLALQ